MAPGHSQDRVEEMLQLSSGDSLATQQDDTREAHADGDVRVPHASALRLGATAWHHPPMARTDRAGISKSVSQRTLPRHLQLQAHSLPTQIYATAITKAATRWRNWPPFGGTGNAAAGMSAGRVDPSVPPAPTQGTDPRGFSLCCSRSVMLIFGILITTSHSRCSSLRYSCGDGEMGPRCSSPFPEHAQLQGTLPCLKTSSSALCQGLAA